MLRAVEVDRRWLWRSCSVAASKKAARRAHSSGSSFENLQRPVGELDQGKSARRALHRTVAALRLADERVRRMQISRAWAAENVQCLRCEPGSTRLSVRLER